MNGDSSVVAGSREYELEGNLVPLARTAFERGEIPNLLGRLRQTVKSRNSLAHGSPQTAPGMWRA